MNLEAAGSVLLVGAGKMGTAMAAGWLKAGLPGAALTLVDPAPHDSVVEFAAKSGAALRRDLPSDPPGVIVLAVKPQVMEAVLAAARHVVGPDTLVLSIAAGISIDRFRQGLGTDRIVRTMPNTPAQLGKGITGAVAADAVTGEDRELAGALLAAAGEVVWLDDETQIDALTAVSGSGPAYVFNLVEALAAAGEKQGLDAEQAMRLARQTIIGAAALLEADPASAAQLRINVTSPNGVTQAALEILMAEDGLGALMDRAVDAARMRSEELGK
jgi:pyrroline-5-carboxylate reductase